MLNRPLSRVFEFCKCFRTFRIAIGEKSKNFITTVPRTVKAGASLWYGPTVGNASAQKQT